MHAALWFVRETYHMNQDDCQSNYKVWKLQRFALIDLTVEGRRGVIIHNDHAQAI